MKQLITLSILLFVILGFVSCSHPQALVYQDVKNFRIGKLSLDKPEVGMDLQFYNPNPFALILKDATINVYLNNQYIGNASLANTFSVPGVDTFLMPVYLTADLKSIFSNALQIIFNKEVDVKLEGSVKAGKGLFVTVPINYYGRQKLNVF
jgi:LEA14-like dessication related protein